MIDWYVSIFHATFPKEFDDMGICMSMLCAKSSNYIYIYVLFRIVKQSAADLTRMYIFIKHQLHCLTETTLFTVTLLKLTLLINAL